MVRKVRIGRSCFRQLHWLWFWNIPFHSKEERTHWTKPFYNYRSLHVAPYRENEQGPLKFYLDSEISTAFFAKLYQMFYAMFVYSMFRRNLKPTAVLKNRWNSCVENSTQCWVKTLLNFGCKLDSILLALLWVRLQLFVLPTQKVFNQKSNEE